MDTYACLLLRISLVEILLRRIRRVNDLSQRRYIPGSAESRGLLPKVLRKEMMYEPAKAPRFEVGNRVLAVAPTNAHRGKEGVIREIIEPARDNIYRYVVRFVDGTTDTLFGFELQLL